MDETTPEIVFLTFEDVCEIHKRGISEFGQGQFGMLDEHAIRSASGQPEAGFAEGYFHTFPSGMAAAYLYFLTNPQGFINGNKRTAVGCALEFLARNGFKLKSTTMFEVYELTVKVAGENVNRDRKLVLAELAAWIEQRLTPVDP